ncbi:MAG: hypothetical protein JNJ86_11180 [Chitinophagaceae bacterium]|nr:hypothetical protein [Chitinophagaceae bacterium]
MNNKIKSKPDLSLFIIGALLSGITCLGQSSSPDFSNIYPIKSIDWQNFKFEDIKAIDEILQNKKMLVLSESDHGHGASIDAQTMIIKGLIDSSRIRYLYIESSSINCEKICLLLKEKGKPGIQESLKYMHSLELKYWVKTGFWSYLAEKIIEGKVVLRGIDITGISPIIVKELFSDVNLSFNIIDELGFSKKESDDLKFYFDPFEGWNQSSVLQKEDIDLLKKFIDKVEIKYLNIGNKEKARQWGLVFDFFYWIYVRNASLRGNKYINQIVTTKQLSSFNSARDKMMYNIFADYLKVDTGYKSLCSISAYHGLRDSDLINEISSCCKDDSVKSLMEYFDPVFMKSVYSICFLMTEGEYGIVDWAQGGIKKVKKPIKGSLERYLSKTNYNYGFLDLRKSSFKSPFYMRVVFNKFLKGDWEKIFPGIFYIRKMTPLTLL